MGIEYVYLLEINNNWSNHIYIYYMSVNWSIVLPPDTTVKGFNEKSPSWEHNKFHDESSSSSLLPVEHAMGYPLFGDIPKWCGLCLKQIGLLGAWNFSARLYYCTKHLLKKRKLAMKTKPSTRFLVPEDRTWFNQNLLRTIGSLNYFSSSNSPKSLGKHVPSIDSKQITEESPWQELLPCCSLATQPATLHKAKFASVASVTAFVSAEKHAEKHITDTRFEILDE